GVGFEVEGEGAAGCSLREAGDERALLGGNVGAAGGEQGFDLFDRKRTEADVGAAGADGRQQLAGVLREDEDVDGVRRLLQNLEQRVGGLLHHAGGGEDEDLVRGLAGQVMSALDEGAYLAELDEELGRVGRQDEDVGVRLDEDAGLFLVGLAQVFAGEDGGGDLFFEVGGTGDAGAVGTFAAEAGEGLAGGRELAGLALALDGHGKHEGEGVLPRSGWAGEDERVRQATGRDAGAQRCHGRLVAEELVEAGCERGRGVHGSRLPSPSINGSGGYWYTAGWRFPDVIPQSNSPIIGSIYDYW